MKRRIIYHGGPTNSGKTYHALQALRQADPDKGGGVFCGPLRLLALEVYEQLNTEGVYCSLMTGQERTEVDFANHTSCTIEMVNVNKTYDVAVIDEIQMIGNATRGFAWTRALLGLQAREVRTTACGTTTARAGFAGFSFSGSLVAHKGSRCASWRTRCAVFFACL
jgi:ATP-dependent RNA helicase SUPV3L1/SUV3